MSEEKKQEDKLEDKVLDHNYDGIQEYDNDLPRWWLFLFWGAIIYGIGYFAYFHMGPGKFTSQRLDSEMASIQKVQKKVAKKVESQLSEESLLVFASAKENIDSGKAVYESKCTACHLSDGGGSIGPNLADNYWIHGGSLMDIRRVILDGVPEKGMLSWKAIMNEKEVKEVVAYIHSLRETTPATPKASQGEEFIYPKG